VAVNKFSSRWRYLVAGAKLEIKRSIWQRQAWRSKSQPWARDANDMKATFAAF